jgi:hypothetical protein
LDGGVEEMRQANDHALQSVTTQTKEELIRSNLRRDVRREARLCKFAMVLLGLDFFSRNL